MTNILLVEDMDIWASLLKIQLKKYGRVYHVKSSDEALKLLDEVSIDLVYADLELNEGGELEGSKVVERAKKKNIYTIVLTSRDEEETIDYLLDECGADDYFTKPGDKDQLVEQVTNMQAGYAKNIKKDYKRALLEENIFTRSQQYREQLFKKINLIDEDTKCVLVVGETGTGKTRLVDKVISKLIDPNKEVARIDCGSVATELIDSTLFGYEKGAFTGADQDKVGFIENAALQNKILFMDDVQNLSQKGQQNLRTLRDDGFFYPVGSNKKVFVRNLPIIFGGTDEIDKGIEDGTFRKDVYERISPIRIDTLPLRFRKNDIVPFVKMFALKVYPTGKVLRITTKAQELLQSYPWEGNTRELENRVKEWALGGNQRITPEVLGDKFALAHLSTSDLTLTPEFKSFLLSEGYHCFIEKMGELAMAYMTSYSSSDLKVGNTFKVSRSTVFKFRKKQLSGEVNENLH